jgi:hypothetical protein
MSGAITLSAGFSSRLSPTYFDLPASRGNFQLKAQESADRFKILEMISPGSQPSVKARFFPASGHIEHFESFKIAKLSTLKIVAGELELLATKDIHCVYNVEVSEMTSASSSRTDVFVTQTLPVLAVVITAAWVMYTRLDDSIVAARLETKQDLKGSMEQLDVRFNRVESRLESIDGKLDTKISSVSQQLSDLRVRQTQADAK